MELWESKMTDGYSKTYPIINYLTKKDLKVNFTGSYHFREKVETIWE